MKTTIAQFIPIIITWLLLSYSKDFVQFSYSSLGKLIAIALILFYTYLDKYLGGVICLMIIIYYQSDYVENMLNTDDIMNKLIENAKNQGTKTKKDKSKKFNGSPNRGTLNQQTDNNKFEDTNKVKQTKGAKRNTNLNEAMSDLSSVYGSNTNIQEGMTVIDQFRNEHCKGTTLMHKDMKVKPDMVEHIYPNIQFNNGKCNICDRTCDFSIIENRLRTEKALLYDKDKTKDAFTCETCNSK